MRTHSWFRTAACLALAAPIAATAAPGQTAPPPIAFEVVSIKPSAPPNPMQIISGQAHVGMHINAARVDCGFTPLMSLIVAAYKVKSYQVTGPSWLNNTFFDIVAKLPDGASTDQIPEMLQTLLADRFKMTMHRENKEHAEFDLVVAKGGAKLKEAEPDNEPAAADEPAKPGEMTSDTPEGRIRMSMGKDGSMRYGGPGIDVTVSMGNGMMHMEATRVTMKAFAETVLSRLTGNAVVDKTGLKGSYQLSFDFSMEEMMAIARANGAMTGMGGGRGPVPAPGQGPASDVADPSGPSLATLIQGYGLKLVPQKTMVDFIVIDHIEKTPTEN